MTFTVEIQSPRRVEAIPNVRAFQANDSSGSFSLLSNAERRITVLSNGIATLKFSNETEEYVAIASGVLVFQNNSLAVATRAFLRGSDPFALRHDLEKIIAAEELAMRETRRNLRQLDEQILRRLSNLNWKVD